MKKSFRIFAAGAALAFAFLGCTACGNDGGETSAKLDAKYSFNYFNTDTTWVFETTEETAEKDSAVWDEICSSLDSIDKCISVAHEQSFVSAFNAAAAGAEVEIDETAYDILALAKELYEKTERAYNPAVGNLIDLWGFSPRFSREYAPQYPYDRENPRTELPNEAYIEAFLALSDFSAVKIREEDGKYYALKPDCSITIEDVPYTMQINLGGIGKGYAVDQAEKIIRDAGYECGYFNLGGSSMSALKNLGESDVWRIGVLNPRVGSLYSGSSFMAVNEKDVCLSSSGDYNQFYKIEGKRYSHIINPATGYPVNAAPGDAAGGIICASVFGLSAAEGDATTTALMVMGKDRAIEYILEKLSGVHACFVYENGDGTYTLYTNMEESNYTLYADIETVKI